MLTVHLGIIDSLVISISINECPINLQLKDVHVFTETRITTQTYTAFFVH